jgi:hypothetical protein
MEQHREIVAEAAISSTPHHPTVWYFRPLSTVCIRRDTDDRTGFVRVFFQRPEVAAKRPL